MAGFTVLENLAKNSNVIGARYANHLDGEDQGIYYQIKYKNHDGIVWKVDMWLMGHDHPGPCARDLVGPLQRVLNDQTREASTSRINLMETEASGTRTGRKTKLWSQERGYINSTIYK
ncbi:hypothetical protein [Paenibacillus glacialis]|uniref:Uncharacterized protein n=1 Tax=Paenibacillus glacialis TaxID=494026 RepID=A0A168N2I3_9BACL|nr:hypothetical protein [Paenibacillus glacialis]OAB45316.1 hypothetical protein PGLA_03415 [Paenibacillus glacialis]